MIIPAPSFTGTLGKLLNLSEPGSGASGVQRPAGLGGLCCPLVADRGYYSDAESTLVGQLVRSEDGQTLFPPTEQTSNPASALGGCQLEGPTRVFWGALVHLSMTHEVTQALRGASQAGFESE